MQNPCLFRAAWIIQRRMNTISIQLQFFEPIAYARPILILNSSCVLLSRLLQSEIPPKIFEVRVWWYHFAGTYCRYFAAAQIVPSIWFLRVSGWCEGISIFVSVRTSMAYLPTFLYLRFVCYFFEVSNLKLYSNVFSLCKHYLYRMLKIRTTYVVRGEELLISFKTLITYIKC